MALSVLGLMFRQSNRTLPVAIRPIARGLSTTPKYLSVSASLSSHSPTNVSSSQSRFTSTLARRPIQLLNASQSNNSLLVDWSDGDQGKSCQNKFDYFWLRDNCQCSQCYNANQRMFDTASLPKDVQPRRVTLSGNSLLEIKWHDGHESNYSSDWLLENAYDCSNEFLTKIQEPDYVKEPIAWGREIGDDPPRVGYNGVMKDDGTFLEMSDKLDVYGFCLVEDTPLEPAATEDLINRVGVLRNTFYGGICIVTPELQSNVMDTAYTNLAIEPHTDANYLQDPPGLMIFHTLKFKGTEPCYNYYVDGQKLSETVKEENPVHYQILCNVPLPYCHGDDCHKYLSSHIPFTIDPETQQLTELHFNNYDRLPLNRSTLESLHKINPSGSLLDVYEAIQTFLNTMRRRELQFRINLQPGTAIVLDNLRLMHARTEFKGMRTLHSAYINREDWRSNVMTIRKKLS